jgi:hypothetical protein
MNKKQYDSPTGVKTNLSTRLYRLFNGRNVGRFLLVCALMLGFSIVGKAVTLWQNTNTTTIISNNSISCNLAGEHANNSYWRAFTPSVFGQTGTFTVTGVRIGVEEATAGSGGNQPITVRIYTNSGGAFPAGTRTLIGSTNTTVANGTLFFQDIAVTAPIQPVTTEIVVEVFTPSGQTVGNRFFIGSNNLGQSAPNYISAADCGAPNPTNVASAGAPNMHSLIGLVGNNIPSAASVSVSGRVLTADGNGLQNAIVSLTDTNGVIRTARTSSFGYYRFEAVEVGETYIFTVSSKRYTFVPQVIFVTEATTNLDFTALP